MNNQCTHEEFVVKLDQKSPDRDWELLDRYTHNLTPIKVRDKHGICLIKPNSMLQGSRPNIKNAVDKTAYTISRFKELWGEGMFDYSEYEYRGVRSKSLITCKKGGHRFLSDANNHLSKRGCPGCCEEGRTERVRSNTDEFIEKATKVHGDRYDYSLVNYETAHLWVKIICPEHGEFEQKPNSHLNGHGCSSCGNSKNSFYNSNDKKECTLYVIECYNEKERFLKIGVTSNSLSKRFNNPIAMPYDYKVLKVFKSYDNEAVYYVEQLCLDMTNALQYNPRKTFNGVTECRKLSCKEAIFDLLPGDDPIGDNKSFAVRLAGKDREFDSRHKGLTGLTLKESMKQFEVLARAHARKSRKEKTIFNSPIETEEDIKNLGFSLPFSW
jgi:hypothetical protein